MRNFLLFILLLAISCTDDDGFISNLCLNNETFWNFKEIDKKGRFIYLNSQFKFEKGGISYQFVSYDETRRGSLAIISLESSSNGDWSYDEKTKTLKTCPECLYVIERFSADTILMTGKGFPGKFALIRGKVTH